MKGRVVGVGVDVRFWEVLEDGVLWEILGDIFFMLGRGWWGDISFI